MLTLTRQDIEILLDSPNQTDYIVSAYADMRVKDGFHRDVDVLLRDQARTVAAALSAAEARKALEANLALIRRSIESADPATRGLAVFSSVARKLHHVIPLDFPVENYLVIDEEPYILPLLERWYGEPNYLIVVADSHHLHLFEAHAGVTEEVRGIDRQVERNVQRDKPRFNYKKRFSQTQHERLRSLDQDTFFKQAVEEIARHWKSGAFSGLILLGPTEITGVLRRLLPRDLEHAIVYVSTQPASATPETVGDEVARVMERWRAERRAELIAELTERWKNRHLIADGPTEVLDALQQGRAAQVLLGVRRDLSGARCKSCNYRFGAPVATCVYCQSPCQTINAAQEIMRMSMRHRVPVHLFERNGEDPLAAAGGVAALLRAEANWAPDAESARASQGQT